MALINISDTIGCVNVFTQKDSWKVKIILIFFSVFVSLIIGEFTIRALEYYEYVKPPIKSQFEQYKKIYSDERGEDYIFGHQNNINVKLEKGYYNFTFITNSEGLRETKDYKNLKKSVIYLGDSIVEGASVENHETMDEVFERNTGITSLNFGVGSSNTVHEFYWLRSKYKDDYNTKLIILGFCLNDFNQNNYLRYFDPSLGNWSLYKYLSKDKKEALKQKKTLLQHAKSLIKLSKLARFININVRSLMSGKKDLPPYETIPPYRMDYVTEEQKYYTELYLNKIRKFSDQIESEFVVIIFPQKMQFQHDYVLYKRMQDALIDILERNKIAYIDLYDIVKVNVQTNPNIRWFHDDTHPYKAGHRLIGEHLSEKLPEMFPRVFE